MGPLWLILAARRFTATDVTTAATDQEKLTEPQDGMPIPQQIQHMSCSHPSLSVGDGPWSLASPQAPQCSRQPKALPQLHDSHIFLQHTQEEALVAREDATQLVQGRAVDAL